MGKEVKELVNNSQPDLCLGFFNRGITRASLGAIRKMAKTNKELAVYSHTLTHAHTHSNSFSLSALKATGRLVKDI